MLDEITVPEKFRDVRDVSTAHKGRKARLDQELGLARESFFRVRRVPHLGVRVP
jgi:hypothetical protein